MEDSGLGLLLKNGYRSQWEREETIAVGGTVEKCLWGVPEQGQAGLRRTARALCMLSTAPPTTLSLQISVFVSCTGSFLAMSKP